MEPFTRSDLKREQEAFAIENSRKYVQEAVRIIYNAVKKESIEMNDDSYFYTIHWEIYRDVKGVAIAIRDELFRLFPDFTIKIGVEDDGCGSWYISVHW